MRGHRVGQGQLTQPPILQGCLLWRNLELPSCVGMRNTQAQTLPRPTICRVTSVGVRLSVWPGVWASVKAHKKRGQESGWRSGL